MAASKRAKDTAGLINGALDSGLGMYEIKTDLQAGAVIVRDSVILQVGPAEAALMNTTPAQAAQNAAAVIREVVWREMIDTIH